MNTGFGLVWWMNIINWICEKFRLRRARLRPRSSPAERGQYGEDLAAAYCRRALGYHIVARNWRHQRDEIDLICLDGLVLVFIEVRARSERALVSGYHSIDAHKKKVLQRGCTAYLKQLQNPPKHFRFDVVDVELSDDGEDQLHHYANVALFSKHYITKYEPRY